MATDDFVMTIASDDEEDSGKASKSKDTGDDAQLNPDFTFDLQGDPYAEFLDGTTGAEDVVETGSKPKPISVDDIIERRKLKRKRAAKDDVEEDSDAELSDGTEEDESEEDDESDGGEEFAGLGGSEAEEADPLATSDEEEEDNDDAYLSDKSESEEEDGDADSDSSEDSEEETQAEKDRKAAFFDSEIETSGDHTSFVTMNLSRPILKAVSSLGFTKPTPIQAATIPVALLGKDIVGNAVTGSGKTAAFIIPMLERLLYRERGKNAAATRCLVLVPTRELGVQCYDVGTRLAAHTDIRFCLVVGGLSLKAQETSLRTRPDVIIATPGRLIDHVRNTPSFTLDALDILVLDEADRMLSDGFADELTEIIKSCPSSRQTMLFSATMTDSVDDLVRMSLNKPVRLFVDPKRSTARGLVQEFVRVRKEDERSALLATLCKRTFKVGVIIFFRSKKLAHQMRIVFSLLGMKCEELHGDLTQEQRLKALQQFRDGAVDFLMATDLASRGLDIKGIETVINYDMPGQLAQYLHRVGRTARAGKKGRSVTLVGEADRKMLKAAIKHAAGEDQVRHRQIPAEAVTKWSKKLDELKEEIGEVLQEEKEEKQLRQAEMELRKGQNMIEHEEEIHSRPARTWFQTTKEKAKAQEASKLQYEAGFKASQKEKGKQTQDVKPKREKYAGLSRRAKRRKMAMEEDEGETGAIRAAVRAAKKAYKPPKIGEPDKKPGASASKRKKAAKKASVASGKVKFDREMGQRTAREGQNAASTRDPTFLSTTIPTTCFGVEYRVIKRLSAQSFPQSRQLPADCHGFTVLAHRLRPLLIPRGHWKYTAYMDSQAFKTCSTVKFSSAARLLPSSWCPDKDLVLVVTNVAGKDRLALWPREGGRKMWEVDINREASEGSEVTGVAWSPDGLHIAVSHHPLALTLHSLQDGRQDRALLTGSAHSILKSQPLLDALHDDSQPLSASELFAFQGSQHARSSSKSIMPQIISSWPTLPIDLNAASFQSFMNGRTQRPGEELDEVDDSNVNSILVVSDNSGNIYGFLDGYYPLGTISLDLECTISSMYKSDNVRYYLHPNIGSSASQQTLLRPVSLNIPFLQGRTLRDVARVSTSARELAWYAIRVVKEMRGTWFGSDTHSGAREAGPKWLRALEQRQKQKYGVDEPNAILDLTVLLATGRASESLSDFLGSGEQMSERSLQKWESSVTEALIKLRDYANRRIVPACHRLHVFLQEVQGWSQLPQFALCKFHPTEVQTCLDLIGPSTDTAVWPQESARAANSTSETHSQTARHDLLEVNEYLMSGLVVSSIDKWFMGPVPSFSPAELGVPMAQDLTSSVRTVREVLNKPEGLTWPPAARHQDLSRLDRNLDSLIQDLCTRCYSIFNEASNASARSAVISFGAGASSVEDVGAKQRAPLFVRERTVDATGETDCFTQHLAMAVPHGEESFLCLVRTHHDKNALKAEHTVEMAVLQCRVKLGAQEGMVCVDILDAQFFDENILVIIYRPRKREHGPTSIATVGYADLEYEKNVVAMSQGCTREGVIEKTLRRLKDGQITSEPLRLMQARALIGCREGNVTLAVNGRVGRRVACVLDNTALTLEIMDVESADDDGEEMEDA
ncbi:hypothetical protein NM688_g3049 [Phlebia brevispora]|uniref:Uncharacterized protein n=1 Tax=Phlebia brevispora TaxID=194682 RepID=A0ACC1T700_9APHY|nr:hypothetical protein NM688_g3049 [Phlebia brevispora]